MPARDSGSKFDNLEKSPVERTDFEGLQLDTRIKLKRMRDQKRSLSDSSDEQLDHDEGISDEKQAHYGVAPYGCHEYPMSPKTALPGYPSPITPWGPGGMDRHWVMDNPHPKVEERHIWGLRRKIFCIMIALLMAVIIVGAIIGGVVGGLAAKNARHKPMNNVASANATNTSTPDPVKAADVLGGSPLNVVSFDQGGDGNPQDRQTFRIYYQSALGNIKEAVSNGMTSWQPATPIFTDAINNTGLATVTYLNNSQQQGNIFYVGTNGLIQEKRKIFSDTQWWLPGSINSLNLPATGNISSSTNTGDPVNQYDSYRMAAVYSTKFASGPGTRLFYHVEQLNGSNYVQEMVWDQNSDRWSKGAQISNVAPNSHLAATIDEQNMILRLYFSSGRNTLQELWSNITNPHASYTGGVQLPNYLDHNNADLAVVSISGTTYVYHYATVNQTASVGIHELAITGMPGSVNNQETYNVSEPLVASTKLAVEPASKEMTFQPLAAARTVVSGLTDQLFVFWADTVTGDLDGVYGYHALDQNSRQVSNSAWPTNLPLQIPLGNSNTYPSTSS